MQRKLVYTADCVHAMAASMRADLVELHERHLAEHNALRVELNAMRAEVAELRDVMLLITSTLHQQAEHDVHTLRRQLETALVRLERRDPAQPLH